MLLANAIFMNEGRPNMPLTTEEELKRALKEALKEWLDDKFMTFGKWSLGAIAALALAALTYFILMTHGWQR